MKKVIEHFPKSIQHFSDKPLSRTTIYRLFKVLDAVHGWKKCNDAEEVKTYLKHISLPPKLCFFVILVCTNLSNARKTVLNEMVPTSSIEIFPFS